MNIELNTTTPNRAIAQGVQQALDILEGLNINPRNAQGHRALVLLRQLKQDCLDAAEILGEPK